MVKKLPARAGDLGLIPGSGRSLEEGNGNHSSNHAWKIPQTEEPGRLQSLEWQKSWTRLSDTHEHFSVSLEPLFPASF